MRRPFGSGSEPDDLFGPMTDVEAGLGRDLRLGALRSQFAVMKAIFVYDLEETDNITLGMASDTEPEPITRLLRAELVGRGVFKVLEDEMGDSEWLGKEINFGTYAERHGPMVFTQPGILRGFITPGGCVAVDLTGKDFFDKGSDVQCYPDTYASLSVNDSEIF